MKSESMRVASHGGGSEAGNVQVEWGSHVTVKHVSIPVPVPSQARTDRGSHVITQLIIGSKNTET
jgi:hypothetical protein